MSPVIACLLAFVSGAMYELGCVFWVHNSERGNPFRTALLSMFVASCEVIGVGQSVTCLIAAPFFIIGYGTGSYVGVMLAKRRGTGREEKT